MFIANKYTITYFRIIERAQSRIKPSQYCEKHHVIPKCLGGSDVDVNIAVLTAREHLICHALLVKMTTGQAKAKMVHAAMAMHMNKGQRQTYRCRQLSKLREAFSEVVGDIHRGRKRSEETKRKISEARKGVPSPRKGKPANYSSDVLEKCASGRKGKKWNEEQRRAISERNTGSKRTEETKARMRDASARRGPHGPMSEEQKRKISETLTGRKHTWGDKIAAAQLGRVQSEATKQKIRAKHADKSNVCEACGGSFSKSAFARWHGAKCNTARN